MKKIIDFIKRAGFDKVLHFKCGFLTTIVVGYFVEPFSALWLGALLGMLKEAYDIFFRKTNADMWDFVATLIGSGVAYGIIMLSVLL